MMKWVYLFLGGGMGTIARHSLSGLMQAWLGPRFPVGTLTVNLLGCFLLGFLIVWMEERPFLSPDLRLFLIIGILGGFTTFSSFIFETSNLIKDGQGLLAFWNVLSSVCIGFLMFHLGIWIAKGT